MTICDVHDIVYDTKYCPCCEKDDEIKRLEDEIEQLKEDIENLETK